MNKFTITVSGITRREYFQACHETGRGMRVILAVCMIVFCGLIIAFTGNFSLPSLLTPLAIYILAVGGYELLPRVTYKNQLETIDPPAVYDFNGARWRVTKGDACAEIEWKATPRLHRTKLCVFLYNDETTSSLIPVRLLTETQIRSLETWFDHTRDQYKSLRKKEDRAASEKFRSDHPGLRLGRTGPAWGPWKKK